MKKFFIASIPGILIILLYISYGEFVLWRVGENIPIKNAVKKQIESKEEFYFEKTVFSRGTGEYKFESMKALRPKILALGQSIVLNFRDFFFHPYENRFYNTGLMASNSHDFKFIASLIKDGTLEKPEYVIIGIDYSLVMKGVKAGNVRLSENLNVDPVYDFHQHINALQDIYFKEKLRTKPQKKVGIGYRGSGGIGYRKDGSYSYLWELKNFLKDSTHIEGDMQSKLEHKTNVFKLPISFDQEKKSLLIEALHEFDEMDIELLLYFPPLSDTFFNFAKKDKDFISFFNKFLKFQLELKSMGYDIIPFNTPSELGLNDYYMNNANHPGDVLVARQFYSYCKSSDRKSKFIDSLDLDYLDSLIQSPETNCLSFMLDTLVIN